jgi:hypothetical protein
MKYDFNDIVIVPEILTDIRSRSEVNPFDGYGKLPLFVAPMDSVLDMYNYKLFLKQGIHVCMPRDKSVWDEGCFHSFSLEIFEEYVKNNKDKEFNFFEKKRILVDIANGHMGKLYSLCEEFMGSKLAKSHELMIGNIANPKTYKKYAQIGVNYVRVGIGGGSACLTSANTGVHYPIASLISECYEIKKTNNFETKIVADGGFTNFDEIIKALALGSDYVMLGGIFSQCLESCSKTKILNLITIPESKKTLIWDNYPFIRKFLTKSYRGMSTKQVQKDWKRKTLKTAEGIVKTNPVKYKLSSWVENFADYLKSAMSYTNSKTLDDFKNSEYILITQNALKRFKK